MYGNIWRPNIVVLICLVWLLAAAQLLALGWNDVAHTLLDTDDALRLVQVRELLAGKGWFDLHEMRLNPPLGYDSHWSRLIDGGLAGLFLFFNMFVNADIAERLMRAVWPMLWLLPAICAVVGLAWRMAGRDAAPVVLLLVAVGMPAFNQFRPARIDHHNVQIVLALVTLAAVAWAARWRWAGFTAGIASALGLAIGYESLPFLLLAGAALGVYFIIDCRAGAALSDYGLALAFGTVLAFAATTSPPRWSITACDALAINMVVPVALGGLVIAAARLPAFSAHVVARAGLVAMGAAVAGLAFTGLEPRCLGGPFAMTDRDVVAIWLNHVSEMQSLFELARTRWDVAAALAAFPVVAVTAACALLAWDNNLRRDFGFLIVAATLILATLMMFWSVKMYSYGMWFGMPIVAVAVLGLCARLTFASPATRAFIAIVVAPAVISTGAVAAVHAAAPTTEVSDAVRRKPCFETENYADLAKLVPGLMAAEIDYGPFLLALTPHRVFAAPYHRASAGIRTVHHIFAAPPEEAQAMLAKVGADYLAVCAPGRPAGLTNAQAQASLYGRLKAGEVPEWLEPLQTSPAFTVYRVKP